jgi:hypothetical protein
LQEYTAEFEARIVSMSADDIAEGNWVRDYCTGHIGFCVPVHKNWWFQSFGATSSELWHVEMNSAPLETLNDGPIAVRLVSGSIESIGATDGQVVREGSIVIGYRSWTDNRHFEITADARLESAIRHITESLSVYTEE